MPKVSEKEYDAVQYMPFVDYRSGKKYPNKSSMDTKFYWKSLSMVLDEFLEHNEAKSQGDAGLLKRKHLGIDKSMIRYIGKETNELEESFILGISKTNVIEYVNSQERL